MLKKRVKLPPAKPTPQRFSSLLLHGISIQRINCNFDTKEVLQLLFCTAVNNAYVPKQKIVLPQEFQYNATHCKSSNKKRSCNYFFAPLLITPVCRNKKLFCCKNFSTTLTANFQTKKVLQLLSITLLLHHRSNARVTKKLFSGVTMHVATAARERATTATTTVPRCTAEKGFLPAFTSKTR